MAKLEDRCKEEQVEDVVTSLGGYELLVRLELGKNAWDMVNNPFYPSCYGAILINPSEDPQKLFAGVTKYLVILRDRARMEILLWSLLTVDANGPDFLNDTGDFELRTASQSRKGPPLSAEFLLRTSQPEPSRPASMEMYFFPESAVAPRPFGLPTRGKSRVKMTWKCKVSFDNTYHYAVVFSGDLRVVYPETGHYTNDVSTHLCAIL